VLACLAVVGCSGSVTGSDSGSTSQTTGTAPHQAGTSPSASQTVDAIRLEKGIAASAKAQRHHKTVVVCPPAIAVKTGLKFYCAAQAGGEVTPFLVTEGPGGKLTYRPVPAATTPSVDMPQIEIQIAEAAHAKHETALSVSCPQEMPRQQGLVFVCAVTLTAAKVTKPTSYVVREVNSVGRVTFESR
jgi:hypothetical protein